MTTTEKREWIESKIGKGILEGNDDDCYEFYYKAIHELGMDYSDADRWAWLNTLFNYNIGPDAAKAIINYQYETDGDDVMEFGCYQKEDLEAINYELGLELNFRNFVKKTPIAIKFFGGK